MSTKEYFPQSQLSIVVFTRVLLQIYFTRWEFSQDVLHILVWPLWWLNLFLVHLSISPCKGVWSGNLLRRQPINQGELSLVRGAGGTRQLCGHAGNPHCQYIHQILHLCLGQAQPKIWPCLTPNRTNTRRYGLLCRPTSSAEGLGLCPMSFFAHQAKKDLFMPLWCTVVTLIPIISNLISF